MELQAAVSEHLAIEVLGDIDDAEEEAFASLVVGSNDTLEGEDVFLGPVTCDCTYLDILSLSIRYRRNTKLFS